MAGKLRLRGAWAHAAAGRVGSEPGATQSTPTGRRRCLVRQVPAPHAVCRQIPAQSGEARLRHRLFLNCLPWLSAPLSVLLPTPSVGDGRPILGSRAPCPVPVVGHDSRAALHVPEHRLASRSHTDILGNGPRPSTGGSWRPRWGGTGIPRGRGGLATSRWRSRQHVFSQIAKIFVCVFLFVSVCV